MVTHSSVLAWKIPWTEEPGRLQSMGSQRVRYDWAHSPVHMEFKGDFDYRVETSMGNRLFFIPLSFHSYGMLPPCFGLGESLETLHLFPEKSYFWLPSKLDAENAALFMEHESSLQSPADWHKPMRKWSFSFMCIHTHTHTHTQSSTSFPFMGLCSNWGTMWFYGPQTLWSSCFLEFKGCKQKISNKR